MHNGLARCAIVLILIMLGFVLAALPLAYWLGGAAVESLLAAVGVCVAPGLGALAISHYFAATDRQLLGMLMAMACRLLPPLVVCLWLALNKSAMNGQVFAGFLIAAYLVSLAVETFLSLRAIDSYHSLSVKG